MSKLSTPSISIDGSVLTVSNIDENATGIKLKRNNSEYKTLYVIDDDNSYSNITAASHAGLIANDETVNINLSSNDGFEMPEAASVSVKNATGSYTKISNTTGLLTLKNASGKVSITVAGIASYPITVNYNSSECSLLEGSANKILAGKTASLYFTTKSSYVLPDNVSVDGATPDWNNTTGTLGLSNAYGDVVVDIDCLAEYSISDNVSHCTKTAGNVSKIIESKTAELYYTFDGTDYKCPPTGTAIDVDGASGSWTYISDTSGKITLSNATGNVSFTVSGEEIVSSLTWLINETPSAASSKITQSISFTSNGTTFSSISIDKMPAWIGEPGGISYGSDYVYDGSYETWTNDAYRTITFATAPSGTLLSWLQSNATLVSGNNVTFTETGGYDTDINVYTDNTKSTLLGTFNESSSQTLSLTGSSCYIELSETSEYDIYSVNVTGGVAVTSQGYDNATLSISGDGTAEVEVGRD